MRECECVCRARRPSPHIPIVNSSDDFGLRSDATAAGMLSHGHERRSNIPITRKHWCTNEYFALVVSALQCFQRFQCILQRCVECIKRYLVALFCSCVGCHCTRRTTRHQCRLLDWPPPAHRAAKPLMRHVNDTKFVQLHSAMPADAF